MSNGVRMIHTSDWHLGAGLSGWPEDLVMRRTLEREQAVLSVLNVTARFKAHFLIIAGDIVDGQQPVSKRVKDAFQEMVRFGTKIIGLFIHSTAGHDSEAVQSYKSWFPGEILRPGDAIAIDGFQFQGYGKFPSENEVRLAAQRTEIRRVLVVHSHGRATSKTLEPLEKLADYIVLGDCHQFEEVKRGFAYYSGSPSFRDLSSLDPGARFAVSVVFDESGCIADRVPIDTPISSSLKVSHSRSYGDLEETIIRSVQTADYVRLRLDDEVPSVVRSFVEQDLVKRRLARVVTWKTRSNNYRQYLLVSNVRARGES